MKRALLIVVVIALIVGFIPYSKWAGSSGNTVSVTVTSKSNSPISSVSCEAFRFKEDTEQALAYLIPPDQSMQSSVIARPYSGGVIEFRLSFDVAGRDSLLWTYSRVYGQQRLMVVIVEYKDGRRIGQLEKIPDLRKIKTANIEVP